jgi:hypothetical protein
VRVGALALAAFALALPACGGSDDDVPVLPPGRAIETSRSLSPTAHLFADVVRAQLEVVVDRRLLDPERVRVTTGFEPYEPVGETRRSRRDLGEYTRLRYDYSLRCVTVECIPVRLESMLGEQEAGRGERRTFRFPPTQVRYDDPAEGLVLLRDIAWPPLTSVSRLNEAQSEAEFPFRLSPSPLPGLTHRASPPLFAGVLLLGGLLLLAFPGRATVRWWRARRPAPEPEPVLELSPLERARALVVWSCENGDDVARRKALANLSTELHREGVDDVSVAAQGLAWSRPAPAREAALALAVGATYMSPLRAHGSEADGRSG